MKLIKNWNELSKVPANDKFKIVIGKDGDNGYIKSVKTNEIIYYLSTHTFYASQYKASTKLLQECGFEVELDNWDKGDL